LNRVLNPERCCRRHSPIQPWPSGVSRIVFCCSAPILSEAAALWPSAMPRNWQRFRTPSTELGCAVRAMISSGVQLVCRLPPAERPGGRSLVGDGRPKVRPAGTRLLTPARHGRNEAGVGTGIAAAKPGRIAMGRPERGDAQASHGVRKAGGGRYLQVCP